MGTRTGNFDTGFRRNGQEWMKDLSKLGAWAKKEGFDRIDLVKDEITDLDALRGAGLKVGSVDLPQKWADLMSLDAGKRKDAVAQQTAFVNKWAEKGAKAFFVVAIPEDVAKPVAENYALAVETYGALGKAAATAGAKILFEGWPGGAGLPNLFCNPESLRGIFKDTGGAGLGINYDPSHLIRLGIDHVRFVKEFAERIGHVHAKDTEVMEDARYELGTQVSIFQKKHRWGEHTWRYTIPGHGVARWTEIFRSLKAANYQGAVCVELEDENFCGTEAGEFEALRASLAFLRSA